MNAKEVQQATEILADAQDQDTVNEIFNRRLSVPAGHFVRVKLGCPDWDSISIGPLVDTGDGNFTQLVTVQVDISVLPESE